MIVVADSGPLHYLILLNCVDLLQHFYGRVIVPSVVAGELSAESAPTIVRDWITSPPTWIDVLSVAPEDLATVTDDLDLGERAAIVLAETTHADLLLIDEAAGRAEAKRRRPPRHRHAWSAQGWRRARTRRCSSAARTIEGDQLLR